MSKQSKQIIINSAIYENRVAVIEGGSLEQFYVQQEDAEQLFGNIYKGIVDSVVPGIGAAFVNIGTGKNGFLYISDVKEHAPLAIEDSEEIIIEDSKKGRHTEIAKLLKVGQEILVQVEKESMGTKGPRLTTYISIPGRHIVLTPYDESIGISKRISEPGERDRIRGIIKSFNLPGGMGCIVRTAALGVNAASFKKEIKYLLDLWQRIRFRANKTKSPAALYEEFGLVMRIIRDSFTDDIDEVIVDSKDNYRRIVRFLSIFMSDLKKRVKLYKGNVPVFEKYGIEKEIERIFSRKIDLKSGGSVVIEQTEGMVAIDVNTGHYTGRKNLEHTVFRTNMEAAKEIARQIRLRDIGGIIVIDFIDMKPREHRHRVQDTLITSLKKDKAKSKVLNISPIGVVEMTRQRMRRNLESTMYTKCPYCNGRGLVKSETTVALQILRRIERAAGLSRARALSVWLHPNIYNYLKGNEKKLVNPLIKRCRRRIAFHKDEKLLIEDVKIS